MRFGSMLTVIIPTHNSERALVPTLAMLVPGALTGTVREVIVADAGSSDGTAQVVDVAGCEIAVSDAPLGARLKKAAATARGTWLMFLRPGVVLDGSWVEEAARAIDTAILRGTTASPATASASRLGPPFKPAAGCAFQTVSSKSPDPIAASPMRTRRWRGSSPRCSPPHGVARTRSKG